MTFEEILVDILEKSVRKWRNSLDQFTFAENFEDCGAHAGSGFGVGGHD
jgi:hypothetical protein